MKLASIPFFIIFIIEMIYLINLILQRNAGEFINDDTIIFHTCMICFWLGLSLMLFNTPYFADRLRDLP